MLPRWLQLLCYTTIASALLGVFGVFEGFGATPALARTPNFALSLGFFGGVIWVAVRTLRGDLAALRSLYVLQVAQVIAFSIGWRYIVRVGLVGQLLVGGPGVLLEGGLQGQFMVTPNADGALTALGTSLVVGGGIQSADGGREDSSTVAINVVALGYAVRLWLHMAKEPSTAVVA